MRYPELGLTIPDAVMVVGEYVYACFNPNLEQSIASFARPWYTMDDGHPDVEAFEAMDINYDRMNVVMPRWRFSGSVIVNRMQTSATGPLVIQFLTPWTT